MKLRCPQRSQVQHLLALGERRLEAAILVEVEYRFDDRIGLLNDAHEIKVLRSDHALADQPVLEPIKQSAPERRTDQNDWNAPALAGLHQCQTFGQLVERPKAARQH